MASTVDGLDKSTKAKYSSGGHGITPYVETKWGPVIGSGSWTRERSAYYIWARGRG